MTDLFKIMKKDTHHYVLAVHYLLYFIVSDVKVPGVIGELVDTIS